MVADESISAHLNAFEKVGILHRDISLFNLLSVTLGAGEKHKTDPLCILGKDEHIQLEQKIVMQALHRGLLVDWGYAISFQGCGTSKLHGQKVSSTSNGSPTLYVRSLGHSQVKVKPQNQLNGSDNIVISLVDESLPNDPINPIDAISLHCMGMWAWMATEISYTIPRTPVIHQPYHNFKSFFYILVAICLLYDSPRATKPPKKLTEHFDMLFTVSKPSVTKTLTIQSDFGWTALIVPHIFRYFKPIVPLLEQLRTELILPIKLAGGAIKTNSHFTHRTFITMMMNALFQLLDSSWVPCSCEGVATVTTQSSGTPTNTVQLPSFALSLIFTIGMFLSEDTLPRQSSL
ncbi:hypothetical protein EV363DRAFT_1461647 [Boletus edulis]|nr:hypothetical protein EV363DRAFT_1461647 [Boletus edulis]